MRHVDISQFKPAQQWLDNAEKARLKLGTYEKSSRSEFINSVRESNWKAWKDEALEQSLIYLLSQNIKKCWYSETSISGPVDVDHYRPKGTIKTSSFFKQYESLFSDNMEVFSFLEEDNENGWWFLAFDYKNFRICNYSTNRLTYDDLIPLKDKKPRANGKSNFFPLKKGSAIALIEEGIDDEQPCLLDPCNSEDPEFISYNQNGYPQTFYNDPWIKCRVDVSIAVYHLMETRLIEHRREKWDFCEKLIIYPLKQAIIERNNFKIKQIRDCFFTDLADKSKEYSAVAIDCIRYYKIAIKNTNAPGLYKLYDGLFPESMLKK